MLMLATALLCCIFFLKITCKVILTGYKQGKKVAVASPLPLSTIMRGISFSAGEKHLIRFPSTRPFISATSSKVQLTPAESSGTLWASNTNFREQKIEKMC